METAISSVLLARLTALAAASPGREVCGLLLGPGPERIAAIAPAANVSPTPEIAFEVDPAALFAALRAERAGYARLLGHYHSHPNGDPRPSPRDAAAAGTPGALWLILGREALLWRAVPGGAVHGAFEPARLAVEPVAEPAASRHKGAVQGRSGDG